MTFSHKWECCFTISFNIKKLIRVSFCYGHICIQAHIELGCGIEWWTAVLEAMQRNTQFKWHKALWEVWNNEIYLYQTNWAQWPIISICQLTFPAALALPPGGILTAKCICTHQLQLADEKRQGTQYISPRVGQISTYLSISSSVLRCVR